MRLIFKLNNLKVVYYYMIKTEFEGLIVFEPKVFVDERGHFFESYNKQLFESLEMSYDWVQDNQSRSSYGVIRGLHFQIGEYEQAKLILI